MTPETQAKLLRVIQEREVERIGGKAPKRIDVRIIAATNRKLDIEVNEGRFRPDLYYRLNVFPIKLPALRKRKSDIALLAMHFVQKNAKNTGKKVKSIAPEVLSALKAYDWPGNIRELQHQIERAVLLMDSEVLDRIELPSSSVIPSGRSGEGPTQLKDVEKAYIIRILKFTQGKISGVEGAAELMDIPPTTLHSKIKKLGIKKSDYMKN